VPEIDDKPESGSEVVAELVSLQEEISPWPTKVVELPIETLINLPAEPIRELVPSLAATRASDFLRLSDAYDPLQIFIHDAGSQEIGALVCELTFSRAELSFQCSKYPRYNPDIARYCVYGT